MSASLFLSPTLESVGDTGREGNQSNRHVLRETWFGMRGVPELGRDIVGTGLGREWLALPVESAR